MPSSMPAGFGPRRLRTALAMGAIVVVAAGCGPAVTSPLRESATFDPGAGDPTLLAVDNPVDMRGQSAVTIETDDNTFAPKEIEVSPGTKVTWTNKGFNQHNVTPVVSGQFDPVPTGGLDPGASADRSLATGGVYRYYCTIHGAPDKGQRALIVVAP